MQQRDLSSRAPSLGETLGLGCAYLTAGFEQARNIKLVHSALEVGFRHFDVAPPYGTGTAETVLGAALAGRRADCFVASKAGIVRPSFTYRRALLRAVATPVRRFFPKISRAYASGGRSRHLEQFYDPLFVDKSLFETLKHLKTDYLDLFLLHEANPGDVSERLIELLEMRKGEGVIRAYGVAGSYSSAVELSSKVDVLQYSWSAAYGHSRPLIGGKLNITHRSIAAALEPIGMYLNSNPLALERLSSAIDVDLGKPGTLADILVAAAVAANPEGKVLVASRSIGRIRNFANVLNTRSMLIAGAAFTNALAEENFLQGRLTLPE